MRPMLLGDPALESFLIRHTDLCKRAIAPTDASDNFTENVTITVKTAFFGTQEKAPALRNFLDFLVPWLAVDPS